MSADTTVQNTYLERVVQDQAELEADLKTRAKRHMADEDFAVPAAQPVARSSSMLGFGGGANWSPMPPAAPTPGLAHEVRVTGALWWKTVVVPPNAYVVHTRHGHDGPVHIGLGTSFRFKPRTDAFLVVPAAMQTILIQANCICSERQGLLVQGYVQWEIDDFATAYHKLDFSDDSDPMRIVNLQLREQAEAAIKDTVATMSLDAVLTDKQPIIEELTERLRAVAEGAGQEDRGLGLRIVTVQIKEAVVCSAKLWENMQRPFRVDRKQRARLLELESEAELRAREAAAAKSNTRTQIESEAEITRLRAEAEAAAYAEAQRTRALRAAQEAEMLAETQAHERHKIEHQHALAKMKLERDMALAQLRREEQRLEAEQDIALQSSRRKVEGQYSQEALRMALIERLPELAKALPHPEHLNQVKFGDDGLTQLSDLLQALVHDSGA